MVYSSVRDLPFFGDLLPGPFGVLPGRGGPGFCLRRVKILAFFPSPAPIWSRVMAERPGQVTSPEFVLFPIKDRPKLRLTFPPLSHVNCKLRRLTTFHAVYRLLAAARVATPLADKFPHGFHLVLSANLPRAALHLRSTRSCCTYIGSAHFFLLTTFTKPTFLC